MRFVALSTLVLLVAACRDPLLKNASGEVAFRSPSLDLGQTWQGVEREQSAWVQNRGRGPLEVEWTLPEGFEFSGLPSILPAGEVEFTVRFRSDAVGKREGVLIARWGSTQSAQMRVSAEALPIPKCPTPVACHTVHFDTALGKCVEEALPDGTACDPHSVCILDATCQGGRCIGTSKVCDDNNACTLNVCNPVTGCEFPPAPPCPGDGKCQLGVCDPVIGCSTVQAPDGTSCGQVTCDAAEVCISGACVVRDPPDGYVCAEASPCQSEGVCQGSACVRGPVTPLQPSWSFNAATAGPADVDGGTTPLRLHDFVMEPTGDVSLFGFYESPMLRASTVMSPALSERARRCIDWNGRAACADFGQGFTAGTVALLDFETGTPAWIFSLAAERSDIAGENDSVFMARLVSMGTDRLAAVFESYPSGTTGSDCRRYYIVALDASGAMQWVQKLSDPMLDVCNHPHPYGAASDVEGNLFLAFSPSVGKTPLAPQTPTLLLSLTRDGVLRWKKLTQQIGGELAVANGHLFPEHSALPLDAATGDPISAFQMDDGREELGRVIASPQRYVTSPFTPAFVFSQQLHAYTRDGAPAWMYSLPSASDRFVSREIRTIDWKAHAGRPTITAVLGFARINGQLSLVAVKEQDGSELWTCPVSAPDPDLFEVANGSFGLMTGSTTCGTCDPPFANSASSFWKFEAPGMLQANVPWPGTFGGASHDHAEKGIPVIAPPKPAN